MLGVDVSLVRDLDDLQVVNYRTGQCPRPSPAVQQYISTFGHPVRDTGECCTPALPDVCLDDHNLQGVNSSDTPTSGSSVELSDSLLLAAEELQGRPADLFDVPPSVPTAVRLVQQVTPAYCKRPGAARAEGGA